MATVEELVALARIRNSWASARPGSTTTTPPKAAVQQESLRIHIEAARRTGLPLIIHARDADDDMARILTEEHRAGRLHLRDALLFLRRGAGRGGARSGLLPVDVRHRRLPEKPSCARSSPPPRWTASSSRPTRPISPRRPIAASATSRPTPPTPRAVGAEVFGMDYAEFAAQTQANFDRLFCQAAERPPPDGASCASPSSAAAPRAACRGWRPLGRLRPREPEEPPPPLFAAGRAGAAGITRVLIDTSPDLRAQLLDAGIGGSMRWSTPMPMPIMSTGSTTCA
jgi:TatD DNase family protein